MLSKVKSTKLVEIFFYVSAAYEKELKFSCERFSNNCCPEFTDQEIMTVYLFCISQEQRTKIRHIYDFANDYMRSWFPKLPSYAAFNNRINRLPEAFRLLTASLLRIENGTFFGDKIYHNVDYFENLAASQNSIMLTPVKAIKGQSEWEKQHDRAANDLFSKAVSTVRQPIESFFNWLIEKTDFQRASKVRSANGLLVHVFGKLAAAFIYLIFNP